MLKAGKKNSQFSCSPKLLYFILLILTERSSTVAQSVSPDLKVYSPIAFSGNYASSPQIRGIIQSKEGLMYFANGSGILEFDGTSWRMVEGSTAALPRYFAMDSAGVIYAAGINSIGYLAADSTGLLTYHSLLYLLNEHDREFGLINNAQYLGNAIYFLSEKQVMRFWNKEMRVWNAKSKFLEAHPVNDTLYVEQEGIGLMKVSGNEMKLALSVEDLSGFEVLKYFKSLCPCNEQTNHWIAKDSANHFFLFNGSGRLVTVSRQASELLNKQHEFKTAEISDGKTAVGTYSGGVIILNRNGELARILDKNDGLPDNIVNALYIDDSDGLWIGHDLGLSRTQLNSPFSFFDQSSGYTGIVVSALRVEDKLYVSTTDGVYVEKDSAHETLQFEQVPEMNVQGFTLLEKNKNLLASTAKGVYQINRTTARKIADGIAIDLFTSPVNDDLMFAGMSDGIITLTNINGKWTAGERIAGLNDVIYKGIADKSGDVWVANYSNKIYRVDLSFDIVNSSISAFDSAAGVPEAWIEPVMINDEIFFGSTHGVYQYDENKKIFAHSTNKKFQYFNTIHKEAGPIRIDPHGNIWVVAHGKAGKLYSDRSGTYQWDSTATGIIPGKSGNSIWSIYFDKDSIVWMGTTDFLVRYDTKIKRKNIEKFQVYVRKVVVGEDSTLFMGASGYTVPIPELKYQHNNIAFEFSSPFFEGENEYKVKLEGYEEDWPEEWNKETKILRDEKVVNFKGYTNLSPGKYTFRVKAKNVYGFESPEAEYSFTILPPFYFTIWAFIAYAVMLGLGVWGIVVWNTRRLIRAKKRLEGIVKERTMELSITNEELRQAKEFEEQFLANMSHEIRTPMHSVVGLTNLILKSSTDHKETKYLNAIRQSADNMLVIINDILDISKIQSGKLELDEVDFSIHEVIEGVLSVMRLAINEKGLEVKTKISGDVPEHVEGDPVRLNQIILNLVNNAVKFTEKGGITISCRVIEKNEPFVRLEFSVEDTGMGIAPEYLDAIFASFGQGGKEIARKFGGTGLGLSICKQLVELQRGNIGVKSEIGRGSVFFFDILYMLSHRKPVTNKEMKITLDDIPLENLSILLVENNPFNRMVAQDTLEAVIKNAKVDVAKDGAEAILCISNHDYDLVLMDLNMPVMDGYEATRKIRHDLPHPKNQVKIMAISASSTKQEREECIEAGMTDYLAKPFRPEELKIKIASLVGTGKNNGVKENDALTNLDFLEEMVGGDSIKKVRYLKMYMEGAPVLLTNLKNGIGGKDWKEIREAAHSLIPQFHFIGAPSLKKIAEEIERKAKSKSGMEEITCSARELEIAVNHTYIELNKVLEAAD